MGRPDRRTEHVEISIWMRQGRGATTPIGIVASRFGLTASVQNGGRIATLCGWSDIGLGADDAGRWPVPLRATKRASWGQVVNLPDIRAETKYCVGEGSSVYPVLEEEPSYLKHESNEGIGRR